MNPNERARLKAALHTRINRAEEAQAEMDAQETKAAAILARGYGQCAQIWRVLLAEQEDRE